MIGDFSPEYGEHELPSQRVMIVPGEHVKSDEDKDSLFSQFNAGNLDMHPWPDSLSHRLFPLQSHVFVVEGLESSGFLTPDNDLTKDTKLWTLFDLPARPRKLHNEGKIYAVAGDMYLSGSLTKVLSDNPELYKLSESLGDIEDQQYSETIKGAKYELVSYLAAAGLIDYGIYSVIKRKSQAEDPVLMHSQQPTTLSRRSFLQKVFAGTVMTTVAASGLVPIGRMQAQSHMSNSETMATQSRIIDLTKNLLRQRILVPSWHKVRPALMVAKGNDVLDQLHFPPTDKVALIIGTAHAYEADDYAKNMTKGVKEIVTYAENLLQIMSQLMQEEYSQEEITIAKTAVLDYLSRYDVIEVTDPSSVQGDIKDTIDNVVRLRGQYQSPTINKALFALR